MQSVSTVLILLVCRIAESCKTKKNRYRDVVCYDETRVVLSTIHGVPVGGGTVCDHAHYSAHLPRARTIYMLTMSMVTRSLEPLLSLKVLPGIT